MRFLGPAPALMVVEPESLCWITGRMAEARDGVTWAQEFARLPGLKAVVRDDGTGLGKGVRLDNARRRQAGLPEFGTVLANPDFAAVARAMGMHGVRVEDPADVDAAVRDAFAHDGPVLLDVLTNPTEISGPGKVKPAQAVGFAVAKLRETVLHEGDQ